MAPKRVVKTPTFHPLNPKGRKNLGKEVEEQKKLQLKAQACKPPPRIKSDGRLVETPKNPNYANFQDPVKESFGIKITPESSTPNGSAIGHVNLSTNIGPDIFPFSPRNDQNNKGVQALPPQCAPEEEASISAQRKQQRMKRLAMMGLVGFLFLHLFWWMFKRSIYRFLGYPDEELDKYEGGAYGARGYGANGNGANENGVNGYRVDKFNDSKGIGSDGK